MASVLKQLTQNNVASAGTRAKLTATSTMAEKLIITAASANTGAVVLGDVAVTTSLYAISLAPGASYTLEAVNGKFGQLSFDLSDIYYDGATTNNKINVGYVQRSN